MVTPGVALKNESHQAKLAMDGDSGDSDITPCVGENNSEDNNAYKNGVGTRVTESPLAIKKGDSGPGELPDCPACGRNEWTYSPDGELLWHYLRLIISPMH